MDTMGSIFGPLSGAFFWLLEFLHNNLSISWSWSIVVLTIIVRIILIPLTWRQLKSMRAMQALAPQIKELQQKYKDDRELLNRKTMEFYQANKVSPFGSCLPLLLQMPVFLGLYYMLRWAGMADPSAEVLGHASYAGVFVGPLVGWLWIRDITKFDYVLMFVYMASQFVASWQTARKSPGQQKMIAYFMPVIVGIFMFIGKWPAGLFIYWVTSNVWTIAQQFFMEKVVPVPVAVTDGDAGKTTGGKGNAGKPVPGKASAGGKTAGGKSIPAKTSSGKTVAGKTVAGKGAPGKTPPGKSAPAKAGPGKTPTKTAPAKAVPGKGAPVKNTPAAPPKSGPAKGAVTKSGPGPKSTPAKTTPAKADPSKAPAGKSGGKSSGEQIGKQGKAATGPSQRSDSGAGGTEGSG